MSEERRDKKSPTGEDEVGELIRSAGRRKGIPQADLAALEETARTAWREMVEEERASRARRRRFYALAATLLVAAVGLVWWQLRKAPAGVEVATIEQSAGRIEARSESGESLETRAGGKVRTGTLLKTAPGMDETGGRLALRMGAGPSVRLDTGTRVRFVSDSRIELQQGAVYVDSGPQASPGSDLEIVTRLGVVREIGTQYEVRVRDETGTVRVREGRVSWSRDGETHVADAGQQLTVQASGPVERATIAPSGPLWDWVLETTPALDIEGRTLEAYLAWISRETGWKVRYADVDLERSAQTIVLHGTIEGLTPDESLPMILKGSGLDYRLENGTLTILKP